MADQDKKTESPKDTTEREPTIRDLDVPEKDSENVKGGIRDQKV